MRSAQPYQRGWRGNTNNDDSPTAKPRKVETADRAELPIKSNQGFRL